MSESSTTVAPGATDSAATGAESHSPTPSLESHASPALNPLDPPTVHPARTLSRALAGDDPRFLFGARGDLLTFGGAVLLSAALLAAGALTGTLDAETSPLLWLALVVGLDVAHVWATTLRVYLDPAELRRRAALYAGTPLAAWLFGVVLHGFSAAVFWRVVAYLAVWHFLRQQIGWLRLLHRRAAAGFTHAPAPSERRLEEALLWLVMLHPVAHWHAHLPRRFAWMVEGDFVRGLDPRIVTALGALTALVALTWLRTQLRATARGRPPAWGRWLLLGATAFAWYAGLVAFDSDYAFTVTNIPLHALPYAWLAVRYARSRVTEPGAPPLLSRLVRTGPFAIAALLILVALLEEAGWDRLVWHDHPQFFGPSSPLDDAWVALLAPLLAVPQLTHYVLDGFVWRREGNA